MLPMGIYFNCVYELLMHKMPLAISPGKYMHCRCEISTLNFILINNYDLLKPHTSRESLTGKITDKICFPLKQLIK
jgi:hypothetical protein